MKGGWKGGWKEWWKGKDEGMKDPGVGKKRIGEVEKKGIKGKRRRKQETRNNTRRKQRFYAFLTELRKLLLMLPLQTVVVPSRGNEPHDFTPQQ